MPKPPLTQPGAASLVTRVYQQLRRDIVNGELRPGEKLRVEALVEAYGVGASPVREALNRLSAERLVMQQDQRGFQVAPISIEDLQELTRARCWVNEVALRESIRHGGVEWEETVLLAFHRLGRLQVRTGASVQDDAAWDQQHRVFHEALISACPSRHLIDFSSRLFDDAERYRNLSVIASPVQRDIPAEHKGMMEASIARRTDEAIALLNEHIQETTDLILVHLRNKEGTERETATAAA